MNLWAPPTAGTLQLQQHPEQTWDFPMMNQPTFIFAHPPNITCKIRSSFVENLERVLKDGHHHQQQRNQGMNLRISSSDDVTNGVIQNKEFKQKPETPVERKRKDVHNMIERKRRIVFKSIKLSR